MSEAAKTIPAAYSEDEKAFNAELETFFGGRWGNPHRTVTRKVELAEIASHIEACKGDHA